MAADFESSSSLFSDLAGPPKQAVVCVLPRFEEDKSLDLREKQRHHVDEGLIRSTNFGIYCMHRINHVLLMHIEAAHLDF